MNKKKIYSLMAVASTAACLVNVNVSADEVDSNIGLIESKAASTGKAVNLGKYNLNIRKSASTSSAIIGSLKEGVTFEIISKSNDWYRIKYNGVEGYVSGSYVQEISGGVTTPPVTTPSTPTNSTTGKAVNLGTATLRIRQSASTSSAILGSLKEGVTFEIISKSNGWYKIKYNGVEGYVSGSYVQEITGSVATPPVTTPPTTTPSTPTTSTTGKAVNLGTATLRIRQSASTSSAILGSLKEGVTFEIISKSNGWYKIKYNGVEGYVSGSYVQEITGSVATPPVTTPPTTTPSTPTTSTTGKAVNLGTASLRIRQSASTSSAIVGYLKEGNVVTILGKSNGWYNIKYGNVIGYVSGEYIEEIKESVSNPTPTPTPNPTPTPDVSNDAAVNLIGKVYGTDGVGLNVRKSPDSDSEILTTVIEGAVINISAKNNGWYRTTCNGVTGYVNASYIKDAYSSSESKFEQVFEIMKAQVGAPYVWGGTGEFITTSLLDILKGRFPIDAANGYYSKIESKYIGTGYRAFDCSGLMQWAFAKVGVSLNRTVASQINNGVAVDIADVKPGDLLFNPTLTHIGMYVGDNKWIESPRPGEYVRIVNVPWSTISQIRRVL